MFHKEGAKIIFVSVIITVLLFLLVDYTVSIEWLRVTLLLIVLGFLVLVLQFFRNPKRNTPINPNHIISSVDGKVVVIEKVFEKGIF